MGRRRGKLSAVSARFRSRGLARPWRRRIISHGDGVDDPMPNARQGKWGILLFSRGRNYGAEVPVAIGYETWLITRSHGTGVESI
jgi:hypothetical protein